MEKYGQFAYVFGSSTQGVIMVELTEARLKDIQIVGNETKDFVIERELTFKPGDVVDLSNRPTCAGFSCWASLMNQPGVFAEEDPSETVLPSAKKKTGSATFGVAYSKATAWWGL